MSDEQLETAVAVSAIVGGIWWLATQRRDILPYGSLVDIKAGKAIADQLPADEDSFILGAWDYVARKLKYENLASDIRFIDNSLVCRGCYLPAKVLQRGQGNCVSKSGLLVSILRNRIPASRVHIALGQLHLDGVGGHSWAEVSRMGNWYLLESTVPPADFNWHTSEELKHTYQVEAFVNDAERVCFSDSLCVVVNAKDCRSCTGVPW